MEFLSYSKMIQYISGSTYLMRDAGVIVYASQLPGKQVIFWWFCFNRHSLYI